MTPRQQFEAWITEEPFAKNVARHPKDSPEAISWPGQYVQYEVQLAWEAWKEGQKQVMLNALDRPSVTSAEADRARKRRGS